MVIDYKYNEKVKPKEGNLIIAEPFMEDDFFSRTVILICESSESSVVGLVLNKCSKEFLVLKKENTIEMLPLYYGGIVNVEQLYILHRLGNIIPNSVEISDGIYWTINSQDIENILPKIKFQPADIKHFWGYVGWTQKQFKQEVKNNNWIICDSVRNVFETAPIDLWHNTLHKMGGKNKFFSNIPVNPTLN